MTSYSYSIVIMSLCRTFSEINDDFNRKLLNVSHPVYLTPPLKEFPLEFGSDARSQKTRMMGLPGGQKSFIDRFSRLDTIQACDRQTDRRTNGQTPRDGKDCAMQRERRAGKNDAGLEYSSRNMDSNPDSVHFGGLGLGLGVGTFCIKSLFYKSTPRSIRRGFELYGYRSGTGSKSGVAVQPL